jgi:hypothetical protein
MSALVFVDAAEMVARRVHPTERCHAAPMNTLAMAGLEAEVGVGDHQPHTTQLSLAEGPEELAPEVFIFGVAHGGTNP